MEDEDFEDPRPRLPVIKCCVDLETVPVEEIGNPWDFMKELDVLKQYVLPLGKWCICI